MVQKLASPTLPHTNELGFYEMRFESIGGLGANLAAQLLAEAAVLKLGFNGANFASYGSEKKGTPVKAYVRLCELGHEVRTSSPVESPHLLAIFHFALARQEGIIQGLTSEGTVVVNCRLNPAQAREVLRLPSGTIGVVDALQIAIDEQGARLNTAMLGAIVRASGFIEPEAVRKTIAESLSARYSHLVPANLRAFDRGYREVTLESFPFDGRYQSAEVSRSVPALGYANAPIGGLILNPGNTIAKDLSASRQGYIPVLLREKCTDCGLCDFACPDYCFRWEEGIDKKGQSAMVLAGIDLQYCKGCLRCIEICPTDALVSQPEN